MMGSRTLYELLFISLALIILTSCDPDTIPRQRGYFRIDLPEHSYLKYGGDCPYSFDCPVYATVLKHQGKYSQPCWIDIRFPDFKAEINVSYLSVNDTGLGKCIADSRKFAYKHSLKADAINEQVYVNPELRVFGTCYRIKGNAASPLQFYLTDSLQHFFRGALYFYLKPNKDSLAPVVEFLESDVRRIIESFEWKNN
ncbi:MAG: gliding motility lipoprotein GldD [Bacteroidetes bacterium]|nr:gliding motility lipoprotein GldD [Bacteroidota bacterium]